MISAPFLAGVPRDVDPRTGKVRRGPIAPTRDYVPREAAERAAAAAEQLRLADTWPVPITQVTA